MKSHLQRHLDMEHYFLIQFFWYFLIFQYFQYTKVQRKPHLQRHRDMEHAQTLVPTPLTEQRIEYYKYYKHNKKIISLRRQRILNQWTDMNKHMFSNNLVRCKRGPCFFLLWSICLLSILLLSCQNDRISQKQNNLRWIYLLTQINKKILDNWIFDEKGK